MSIDTAFEAPKYEPKPGSVAQRAIAHLESLEPGASLTSAALAEAIGVSAREIRPSMVAPLRAGVVTSAQKGGHVRSPIFWAMAPRMDASAARLERAGDGSQTPNGEAVEPRAKAGSDTPRPGPQHVVKAKAARPDATDRVPPATASPRVGAMGVGQAADAAPAGDFRCAMWSEGTLQMQLDGVDVLVLVPANTRKLVEYLDFLALYLNGASAP